MTLNQPAARSQIAADADDVLLPLMDLLDGRCEQHTRDYLHSEDACSCSSCFQISNIFT